MLQIVFNEISAAEISRLNTLEQLQVFEQFQVNEATLQNIDGNTFGKLTHKEKLLYRFCSDDYRIYFEVIDGKVIVHRVLHKNTFKDFLFRTKISGIAEDEELSNSKSFWKLIEEGQNARKNTN